MAYTTIKKPSDYFNTKLYTGNGSTNAITGVGFQPDWTWIKNRNLSGGYSHCVFDSVRGANKRIKTNSTSTQDTLSDSFNSFNSDGFTLGGDSQTAEINQSSASQVSWNWKAGTTSGIATNGATTITPGSYSFNQTSGISIINYDGNNTAGAKVAHGLGATPAMMIVKAMNGGTIHWAVYHKSMGNTHYMQFDTNAKLDDAGAWNDTSPDDVNFTVGNSDKTNTVTYIAYCFAEKQGYSKFGSYTGNGSTDGTFIYTGFKPAFFLVKKTDTANNWHMFDTARNPYNGLGNALYPDLTNAEGTANYNDYLSNGIKIRDTDGAWNASGGSYIYMAFAEQPLVGDNPATAR